MITLITIASLFVIGSLAGYIIEVLFRRIFTAKKWINPGFMVGPYIPLYGFGVIILYGLSNINIGGIDFPPILDSLIRIIIIGISVTLIELIAGLIFIKGMHIKLWDYSNRWGNFKGVICPLFSFIWFVVGCLYYFFLNPSLVSFIAWIGNNLVYSFFIGIIIGMIIVDFSYSLHLGLKIKEATGSFTIRFEQLKIDLKNNTSLLNGKKHHSFGQIVNNMINKGLLKEFIKKSVENRPKPKKWWKKDKEGDKN